MQLTSEERKLLAICGENKTLNSSEFEKLVDGLSDHLDMSLQLKPDKRKKERSTNEKLEMVLILFLTLSAKENLNYTNFCSFFYELNWNRDRVEKIWNFFEAKRNKTRWDLSLSTTFPPHIVDIKWKLDNNLKNYGSQRENDLCYIITLTLQECRREKMKFITFSCTLAQLTNLVTCLRRATRCMKAYSMK